MKKLVFIVITLLAAAAAAWYFLRPGDKARDVVPADAVAVGVLQSARLVEALGLTSGEVKELAASLGDLAEAVDIGKPAYAFVSERGLSGVAINVNDADKLLSVASAFGFASTSGSGYQWLTNSSAIGCFDDDKLLLCGPASVAEQDALRSEMLRLMKQARQDVPILEKANRQEGFLRLSAPLESLPKEYVPKGFDVSGALLSTSLSLGRQDITLSAKVEDKDGKPYSGCPEGEELLRPIDGLLLTALPDNPFAWFCMGVKGGQLLKFLRHVPQVSSMLMMLNVAFFDADLLLKAIDGDVVLMVPKADFIHPEALITAHISNSDFLKNAEDWDTTSSVGDMNLRRRGENDYVFSFQGQSAYFGVRGDLLYIATSERLAEQGARSRGQGARGKEQGARGKEQGARGKEQGGKYLSGSVDLSQLVRSYASVALMLGAAPQLYEAVDALDRLNIKSEAPLSFELSLTTKKPIKEITAILTKDKTD